MYFSQDYTPHDHRFLAALAKTEHQVSYLRLEDRGRGLEQRPVPPEIQLIDWWGGRRQVEPGEYRLAAEQLRSVFEHVQPDLVHAGPIQSVAYLAAQAGARALLAMSWGSDLLMDARDGEGRAIAAETLARSDALACDCQAVRHAAIELGMAPDRIVVFPWGVDLAHFSPGSDDGLRQELGWQDQFVLLSTRVWEPRLGVDDLVSGFVKAARLVPELHLLMLGASSDDQTVQSRRGEFAAKVRGLIAKAGLDDRVHLAGQVSYEQLPRHYRAADLYLSASHSDGSSISLLESMACGLPSLVSDIPGNREWVTPERNGWLFRDGDRGNLAEQLEAIASRREELKAFGRQARRIAEQQADWTVNFERLLDAYALALQGAEH